MSNELFSSLRTACMAGGHIVYREELNNGRGGFERAGKRHAIATFFGAASAKTLNRNTLDKIKEVLGDSFGAPRGTNARLSINELVGKYFTDARSVRIERSGGKRVESAAISGIIDSIRKDIADKPEVLGDIEDCLVRDFLERSASSYGFLQLGVGPDEDASVSADIAGRMARILIEDACRENAIGIGDGQENSVTGIRDMLDVKTLCIWACLHGNRDVTVKDFVNLFRKFSAIDESNHGRTRCLERFVLSFVDAVKFKEGEISCDKMAASRFLYELGTEEGQMLVEMENIPLGIDSYGRHLASIRNAAAAMEKVLEGKGLDEAKRKLAKAEGTRLMVACGVSAEAAAEALSGMDDPKYAVFSGERRFAVLELKTMFGERFDRLPAEVKYGFLAVPAEYRRSLAEAFKLVADSHASDGRAFHHLVSCRDPIKNLWGTDLFTAESILRIVAAGRVEVPLGTTEWTYSAVIENPLTEAVRSCSLEALDKFDIQINTQMERLVFEYGLGPKEARVFLRPAEAAEIGVGIPGKIAHINPHYQILMPEFGGTPERAFRQLRNDLNRAAAYEIAVEHPGLGFSWNIEAKGAPRSEERLAELDKQCAELDTVLKGLCGAENREQIAMVAIGITQSAEMDLMPYAIRAGETKLDGAFEFRFAISAAGNGDVKLHLSNLPDSRLSLDWTITIHPDGTHEATVPAVGRNANRSAG